MADAAYLAPPTDYVAEPVDTTLPITHGVLMAVVWVVLVPLGIIVARHKWMFGESEFLTKKTWFLVHMTLQLTAVAAFIPAIVIALSQSVLQILPTDPPLNLAHKGLGIATLILTGLQVIVAFVRPAPESPSRKYWNFAHHNLGRLLILTAWAAVYTGIEAYVYNVDDSVQSQWLTPIALVNGLMVGAFVAFELASIVRLARISIQEDICEETSDDEKTGSVSARNIDIEMNIPMDKQGLAYPPVGNIQASERTSQQDF